jgi:hypothetical protein
MRYVSARTAYGKPKRKGMYNTYPFISPCWLHGPRSPFGPNIECLERVSSFGRGKFKGLQEEAKQMKQADESIYDSRSTYI